MADTRFEEMSTQTEFCPIDLIRLALDLKERFKERPSVVKHKLKRRTNETKPLRLAPLV